MVNLRDRGLKPQLIREASWPIIVGFIVLQIFAISFINLIIFPSNILAFFPKATSGLINETLLVNLMLIAGMVYLLMIRSGKLSWADLGMKRNRLASGITATLTIWLAMQIINLMVSLLSTGRINWYQGWEIYGAPVMIGAFVAQLFGNALFEELAFRGFLVPQISKKIHVGKGRMVIAVLASQIIFGLMHIPNRIFMGVEQDQMLISIFMPAVLGIFFAIVYLVTDNLFFAVGVHTLNNMPLMVISGLDSYMLVLFLTILLLLIWPFTFGKCQSGSSDNKHGEICA